MNKAKKRLSVIQLIRILSQIIFFLLLPGLFINAFSGIKLIYTGMIEHNLNFSASLPQLISAISIIPITLLLGRFFCGWMCAFGSMGDFLYFLSHKVFKVSFHINEKVDHILKYLKYAILVFLIFAVWSLHLLNTSALSPWDAFGILADFHHLPDFPYVIANLTIGFLILLGIIVASLFVERFFCRYLCPLGAVFSIISRLKFVKIKKPNDKCGSCRACTKKCTMGIPLYKSSSVKSGECINCLQCVEVCPRKNVHVEVVNAAANPALAGALAVTAMTGIYYVGNFAADQTAFANVSKQTVSTATQNTDNADSKTSAEKASAASKSSSTSKSTSSYKYKDGVYQGSATGFHNGITTVSVTVKKDVITDIQIVSNQDTPEFFDSASSTIISAIMDQQSTNVDAVSGATFSSNGIMNAVADALSNAGNS